MKTLNQKKKELFELLHEYFSMKPAESFIEGYRIHSSGKHCALGFLDEDFCHTEKLISTDYRYCGERIVTAAVLRLTKEKCGYGIVNANNGVFKYKSPIGPKNRVLKYLKDQINKLS